MYHIGDTCGWTLARLSLTNAVVTPVSDTPGAARCGAVRIARCADYAERETGSGSGGRLMKTAWAGLGEGSGSDDGTVPSERTGEWVLGSGYWVLVLGIPTFMYIRYQPLRPITT